MAIALITLRGVFSAFVTTLILLCMTGGPAFSQAQPGDPPVYNPASKSYFQVLEQTTQKQSWRFAHKAALTKTYKGVHGRLAVIDRLETHEFVLENFDLSHPTWIGLRYWCDFRMLEWNGLRPYSPGDPGRFHAWHPRWYRNVQTICARSLNGENAYMPFYYQPFGQRNARWQASGPAKYFARILVEFTTGEQ